VCGYRSWFGSGIIIKIVRAPTRVAGRSCLTIFLTFSFQPFIQFCLNLLTNELCDASKITGTAYWLGCWDCLSTQCCLSCHLVEALRKHINRLLQPFSSNTSLRSTQKCLCKDSAVSLILSLLFDKFSESLHSGQFPFLSLFFGEFNQTESRPIQREVIEAALDGNDVFLQAATSFGKSLCFQLPACIDYGSKQRSHQVDGTHILTWPSYGRRITSSCTYGMCST